MALYTNAGSDWMSDAHRQAETRLLLRQRVPKK
jgi:hypothetical protein